MSLFESLSYRWKTQVRVSRRSHGESPISKLPLPPMWMRQGGEHFADNASFVQSGVQEARHLEAYCGLASETRLLELGCGAGRLAIGLIEAAAVPRSYVGLEVQSRHVAWCNRQIASRDPRFRFELVNTANNRYNPQGVDEYKYPVDDRCIDLFYAYSVLSHMTSQEVRRHLQEIARVLCPDGIVCLTAFIEQGVENEVVNPSSGDAVWSGPLHCVRYSDTYFEKMVLECGLVIQRLDRGSATDGQSRLHLTLQ